MAEKGRKAAIVAGVGAVVVGAYLLLKPAEAAPPEPPPPGKATVYGIVTCAVTGAPLAGISVGLWSPDETELLLHTTTNGAGSYSLANIMPGSYVLYFQKEGFETKSPDIVLSEGLNPLNIQLVPIAPPVPEIVVDFDALTILGVEGIPFTSVGEETMQDWEAFGECLKETYGTPLPIDPRQIYFIEDGAGLAMCVKTKVGAMGTPTGETLKQCGIDHPEYLSDYAKELRPPTSWWVSLQELDVNVVGEYGERLYIGMVLYEYDLYTLKVVDLTTVPSAYFDPIQGWVYIDLVDRVLLTAVYKEMTNWDTFGHQAACDYCSGVLAPFTGPVATLAEPIVMDTMRGVTLSCAIKKVTPGDFDWYIEGTLHYEPAFDAPMPPPAFRGRSVQTVNPQHPPFPPSLDVSLKSLFARGYYYRGIYDGIISLNLTTVQMPDYPYDGGRFKIKNLARVTGEGVV